MSVETMVSAARDALDKAYAPYSHFHVAACVLSESGKHYLGVNVENASYPETLCAESGAIAAMVAAGERVIHGLVIVSSGPLPCAPCGGCRQKISEFASKDLVVHMYGQGEQQRVMPFADLLPYSFSSQCWGGTSL
jgi:cytidine deaminase